MPTWPSINSAMVLKWRSDRWTDVSCAAGIIGIRPGPQWPPALNFGPYGPFRVLRVKLWQGSDRPTARGLAGPQHSSALEFAVAIVFAAVHVEGEAATARCRGPGSTCRLRLRLFGRSVGRRHVRGLRAELVDRPVDRRRRLAVGALLDTEVGD